MFNVLSPLVLLSEVLQVAFFCYPTTNKFNKLKTYSFLGSIFGTFWWKTFSGSYFIFNSFSLF